MTIKFAIQIKNPNNNNWYFFVNDTSINHPLRIISESDLPMLGDAELTRMNLFKTRELAISAASKWINQKDIIRYDMQQSAPWIKSLEDLTLRTMEVSFNSSDEFNYMEIADKTYSF